jgi:hypothetical protein
MRNGRALLFALTIFVLSAATELYPPIRPALRFPAIRSSISLPRFNGRTMRVTAGQSDTPSDKADCSRGAILLEGRARVLRNHRSR